MGRRSSKIESTFSKGQRPNVNKDILKGVRRTRTLVERRIAQLDAAVKGKNTYLDKDLVERLRKPHMINLKSDD